MKRKNLFAIVAGLTMMAASGAYAQGYIGGAVGAGNVDVDCTGLTSCDKSNTGYKIYGGYQVRGGWAADVGFRRAGARSLGWHRWCCRASRCRRRAKKGRCRERPSGVW